MIPAPPGLSARYKHTGPQHWTHRRVIAFDDDWQPLIISDDHRLEYASRYDNFGGVTDHTDADYSDITAIMPSGGWRIEGADPDGSKWSEPLAGWGLKNGMVVPLVTDCDGLVDEPAGECRIYHPDQLTPSVPAADGGTEQEGTT